MRIDIRRGEQIKTGAEILGNRTKAKIVKNKVAPPFRVAEFDILYGEGISKESGILDMAVERDIIHKSGAWFSYKDQRIAQGRENARKFLKENTEICEEIEALLRAEMLQGEGKLEIGAPHADTDDEATPLELAAQDELDEMDLLDEE